MTALHSSELTDIARPAPSTLTKLLAALRRMLMGEPPHTTPALAHGHGIDHPAAANPTDASPSEFIIAPGGYRIRVPQRDDVHQNIDHMLPSVRAGLDLVPPLPIVITGLLREVQNPDASAASVAAIISSDPALVASIIRTVNSAAFGLYRKITSVTEAVNYLGFASVKAMVMRLQLDRVLHSQNTFDADVEDVWIHSLVVSYIADCLARRVPGVDAGFVSTLALLHDIGKLVALSKYHEQTEAIKSDAHSADDTMLDREARVLGVDHAALGATLAAKWNLPGDLVQAIRWHHNPERAFESGDPRALHQAVYLVQIANQLAKYCYVYADETEIDAISESAFDALGFGRELTTLLDADVRAAASRAIFFASEGSARPSTDIRRFLTLHRDDAALRLLDTALTSGETAPAIESITDTENYFEPLESDDVTRWRATVSTTKPDIRALLTDLQSQLHLPESGHAHHAVEHDPAYALSMVATCVLANTVGQKPANVDTAVICQGHSLTLAIRAQCLGFAERFGDAVDSTTARRVLAAEMANLLNLKWVSEIGCSDDGATLVFTQTIA